MSSPEENATTEPAKTITPINQDTVHRICSGQVVLSLAIAVKELVENAIDAGATNIEVKVREYGQESIEVVDNGCGVEERNFNGLTAKYHTSKLREFTDLESVTTFGFRGEALSSICALADMKIVTKHGSVDVATRLELNHRGEIVKRTPCARQTGTTVTLCNLFVSLPVRRREFQRNIQKEFVKMSQMLQAYGLISYGKRIILTNHTAKGGKSTIMSTNASDSLMDNIVAIFGARQGTNLLEIRQPLEKNEILTQEVVKSLDTSIKISSDVDVERLGLDRFDFEGYVSSSSHGSGRGARDRQFFYINGRPCDPKTVAKVVNEIYHRYNPSQHPFVVLNINLERKDVDVNVTPDKRQIMVNNETILRLAVKKSLISTWGTVPITFKMENQTIPKLFNVQPSVNAEKEKTIADDKSDASSISDDFEQKICTEKGDANKFANMLTQWRATGQTNDACSQQSSKRKTASLDEIGVRTFKMQKIHEYLSQDTVPTEIEKFASYKSDSDSDDGDAGGSSINGKSMTTPLPLKSGKIAEHTDDGNLSDKEIEFMDANAIDSKLPDHEYRLDCKVKAIDTPNRLSKHSFYTVSDKSVLNTSLANEHKIIDQENAAEDSLQMRENCKNNYPDSSKQNEHHEDTQSEDKEERTEAKLCLDNDSDTQSMPTSQPNKITAISTSIAEIKRLMECETKHEDEQRKQERQNRLKFKAKIDPKLNKSAEHELQTEIAKSDFIRMDLIGQFNLGFIIVRLDQDLFIIDQHATDEKYNFETLQKQTVLQQQPLVVPQDLDLTAVNEIILMDNLPVFEANGFRFEIDPSRPVTKRVKLTGKPFSKNWEFGKEDIDELIFMLQDSTNNTMCRPSRVLAMFASRACRSSVMIGNPLSKSDMRRLVDHMGTLEQPWNCPHGRPTMRYLLNLQMLKISDDDGDNNDKKESDSSHDAMEFST